MAMVKYFIDLNKNLEEEYKKRYYFFSDSGLAKSFSAIKNILLEERISIKVSAYLVSLKVSLHHPKRRFDLHNSSFSNLIIFSLIKFLISSGNS